MKNTIYQCTQHLFGWFSSGAGFKDFGFSLPVGAAVVNETVERVIIDGIAQETTQWLIAATVAVTLYIKIYNFIKKNKK